MPLPITIISKCSECGLSLTLLAPDGTYAGRWYDAAGSFTGSGGHTHRPITRQWPEGSRLPKHP